VARPCKYLLKHEDVEIVATVGERRSYCWRIWATSVMGQWSRLDTCAMRSAGRSASLKGRLS